MNDCEKNSEAYRLCRFVPSEFSPEIIQAEIRPLLPRCCQCERISVRIPQGIEVHPNNMEWHQDGGGKDGTTDHMVVWASEDPTHIRDSSGAELSFEPYDVIWFNNCAVHHKQPRGTDETKRWFVSIRCSGAIF